MKRIQPLVIGVAGGSGSGKTTLAHCLQERLSTLFNRHGHVLAQDHYYIDQSAHFTGDGESVNFDHPSAIDFELLAKHLITLKAGGSINIPQYCFVTHTRKSETHRLAAPSVIIVDGTLILSQLPVKNALDFGVFVKTQEKVRFERRLYRDTHERGRKPEGVKKQFEKQVKPMHDTFVEPSQTQAHLLVSGEASLEVMIQQVLTEIQKRFAL